MERITNLLGERRQLPKPRRHTERGDLFDTLLSHLNPPRVKKGLPPLTYQRLGYLLAGIKTGDLYALLSKMQDGVRRGVAPGAIFWSEVRPPKDI